MDPNKEENEKATMLDLIDANELSGALGGDDDSDVAAGVKETDEEAAKPNADDAKDNDPGKAAIDSKDLEDNLGDDDGDDKTDDSAGKKDDKPEDEDNGEKGTEGDDTDKDELDSALGDDVPDTTDQKSFDFQGLAKDVLGVEIEENTIDAYKKAYSDTITKAKQELDLSKYPEEVKTIIDHVTKNEGKLLDFYNNDQLKEYDRFLSLDRKSMYKEVLVARLKNDPSMSTEEIEAEVEEKLESIDDARLKEVTDNYVSNISAARQNEIKTIVDKQREAYEQKITADTERIKTERTELKSYVDKLTDFEGIPVSDKAKEKIKSQIDSGVIDKVLSENPAKLKIDTYLRIKLGARVKELNEQRMAAEKNKAAEESKKAERMKNHNVKPVSKASSATDTGADDNPLAGFGDDSLYSEE